MLLLQLGTALVVGSLAWMQIGLAAGLGAVSGGAIALVNTQLLVWRMRQPLNGPEVGRQQVRLLYRSAVERFAVVLVLLAIGFKVLKLAPLALVLGFVACQMIWIVYSIMFGIKK